MEGGEADDECLSHREPAGRYANTDRTGGVQLAAAALPLAARSSPSHTLVHTLSHLLSLSLSLSPSLALYSSSREEGYRHGENK